MLTRLLAAALLIMAVPVVAKSPGLTIKTGESWMFAISRGQPVRAHKVKPTVKPPQGQVLVTVTSMMGTTMTISSNNPSAYIYQAELIGVGKAAPARSCTLPANGRLSFEHWPQKASAIRLSNFRLADKDGACP